MKGIFVILDGVADEPCQVLGQITPLQAAKTPNLDEIAKKSKIDYCYPIKEGIIPESSSAVVSLLGYDYRTAFRGPLEAAGLGIKLNKGDLTFRTNFATIDDLKNGNIIDSRAGRTLTTKESIILSKAVNEGINLPFKFEFYPGLQHRGVLVFRGGFSDNLSGTDPFYGSGFAKSVSNPKVIYSVPLDEEDDSKLSAELVNRFVRESHEILKNHPINIERAKKGLYPANFILCRDPGNSPISFKKLKGKWIALGYNPLEIGISKAAKMDIWKFKYPKMKGIDVYANLNLGLYKAIKNAIKMIKRKWKKYDYFYVHFKETDTPGHDNKPLEKVKMIELIDKKFFSYIKWAVEKYGLKLVLTGDHTTSCRMKAHSEKPVPVLSYPGGKIMDRRFIEEEGLKGRKILARKLLQECLFEK